jgi:hypothetical protein
MNADVESSSTTTSKGKEEGREEEEEEEEEEEAAMASLRGIHPDEMPTVEEMEEFQQAKAFLGM